MIIVLAVSIAGQNAQNALFIWEEDSRSLDIDELLSFVNTFSDNGMRIKLSDNGI